MGTLLAVLENLSVFFVVVIVVVSSLLLLLFEAKKRLSENVDSMPLKTELISPQMCTHTQRDTQQTNYKLGRTLSTH